MPNLKINNKEIFVEENTTILQAAEKIGIEIPSLCYKEGYEHFTSCMICVVLDKKTDKLIPSCSIDVEEGMDIETDNNRIAAARKDTMDMLMCEHVGDCEATCTRGCPANMNIPEMLRLIRQKKFDQAIEVVKKDIALPAVLGRICSAPCEGACIHKFKDEAVSICEMKKFVADLDLEKETPYQPAAEAPKDKKIAVVGAGPAGLAAAYYSALAGYETILFDKNEKPGGGLQYGVPEEKLEKAVLDKEIEQILKPGVEFQGNKTLGKDFTVEELSQNYDAVILSFGKIDKNINYGNLEITEKGVTVDKKNFQTSIKNVFAIGSTIRDGRSAIRSCAHGKEVAQIINQFLETGSLAADNKRFNSVLGRLKPGELEEFTKLSKEHKRLAKPEYSTDEAVNEAARCFHCDCRKIDNCRLRNYADEFNADQRRFKINERNEFTRVVQHNNVIFEPGKCIKCNLCVQITEKAGEEFGLVMINRGFDIKISTPFNESMKDCLKTTADECIESCPTAALSRIEDYEV